MGNGTFLGTRWGIERMENDIKTGGMRPPRKLCLLSKIAFNKKFKFKIDFFVCNKYIAISKKKLRRMTRK